MSARGRRKDGAKRARDPGLHVFLGISAGGGKTINNAVGYALSTAGRLANEHRHLISQHTHSRSRI